MYLGPRYNIFFWPGVRYIFCSPIKTSLFQRKASTVCSQCFSVRRSFSKLFSQLNQRHWRSVNTTRTFNLFPYHWSNTLELRSKASALKRCRTYQHDRPYWPLSKFIDETERTKYGTKRWRSAISLRSPSSSASPMARRFAKITLNAQIGQSVLSQHLLSTTIP